MPTDPEVIISLIQEFHQRVKVDWKSVDDFAVKGNEWINSVKLDYGDHAADVLRDSLLQEMRYFSLSKGKAIVKDAPNLLIMKGGGIKGLAYVGALEEIQRFYSFDWFAGTSAGAISAILLSTGCSNDQLREILRSTNFDQFRDSRFPITIYNLLTKSGLYPAKSFSVWLDKLLAKQLNSATQVRLRDLPFRTTVYACKRDEPLIFDSEDPQTFETSAAFAARCSMAIPLYFTPAKSQGLNVFDGGMQNNFPVDIILRHNPDANFVGLYLGNEIFELKKNWLLPDVLSVWTESNDTNVLRTHKDNIILIDPNPISTTQFSLSRKEINFLLEAGRLAALKFLGNKNLININAPEYSYSVRKDNLERTRRNLKLWKTIGLISKVLVVLLTAIIIYRYLGLVYQLILLLYIPLFRILNQLVTKLPF